MSGGEIVECEERTPHENARHAPGVANPYWPLCDEAAARWEGWSNDEIADGELACCDIDLLVVEADRHSSTVTCHSCRELVHA